MAVATRSAARNESQTRGSRTVARLAIGLLALGMLGCSNQLYLTGDSYASIMAPYVAPHTGCPVRQLSRSGRLAAEVLSRDVDRLATDIAALDGSVRPIVILSAGAIDEIFFGPELAAALIDELAMQLLALDPELELLQLDYGSNWDLAFWDRIAIDEYSRWHRVMFPDVVDDTISDDGLHLPKPAYVERLFSLTRQYPSILCDAPGPGFDGEAEAIEGLLNRGP